MQDICLSDYFQGYDDCEKGIKHLKGKGVSYDRGYNARYQEEQIAGAKQQLRRPCRTAPSYYLK
jgi:hypothetical protein